MGFCPCPRLGVTLYLQHCLFAWWDVFLSSPFFLFFCIYKHIKIKFFFLIQFAARAVAATAVPGSVSLPLNWVCREMGDSGAGKMLWNPVGIRKKELGGIKKRAFHSQAAGQRLIQGIEDVIPKSGVLF